ncbi:MAG TPA: phospholipid carrier-dependent glycosyltransferase [Feifaniaceae bacterium]|nr:phospholipid carrier-dependent glycosyltransferase [Feifaniaceae bacterium]
MLKRRLVALCALVVILFASPILAQGGDDLLYNSDFSEASADRALPSGWYYEAWIPESSAAYLEQDGRGGRYVVIESLEPNDARVSQLVTVEPDTYYRITCEILADGIEGDAGATVSVTDTYASSEPVFLTDGFAPVELVGRTGPAQTELVLSLRVGGYGALSSGLAMFRNVSMRVEENPPADAVSFEALDPSEYTGSDSGSLPYFLLIFMAAALVAGLFTLLYRRIRVPAPAGFTEGGQGRQVLLILIAGFLLRTALSVIFVGHSTDLGCFLGWAENMVENGPGGFYFSGMFADYPPGYMYVLWLLGGIGKLLNLPQGGAAMVLLIKLPAILADLISAYLVYRVARKLGVPDSRALLLMAVAAFNPVFAFVSGGWGQIDSLLTLCVIGVLFLFVSGRKIAAGALFGAAILMKPQALMFGPLLAAAYFLECNKANWKKQLLQTALAVLAAVAVILLLALPFRNGQGFVWLKEKYLGTATSYPYASIEAFNLFALIGGNWKGIGEVPFLFSFEVWGYIGITLSVAAAVWLYAVGRKKGQRGILPFAAAFLICALFTTGLYMHERYIFPALLLLLIAALCYNDRRLYASFLGFSVTVLINVLCAFVIVDHQELRQGAYEMLTRAGSLLNVLLFAYLCYAAYDIVFKGSIKKTALLDAAPAKPAENPEEPSAPAQDLLTQKPYGRKLRLTKKDQLYCWGLTALYAAVSLFQLGSLTAPETEFVSAQPGKSVTLTFDAPVDIAEYWVFGGIAEGTLQLTGDDGGESTYDQRFDNMFRWHQAAANIAASELQIKNYTGKLAIREIAFFDANGKRLTPKAVDAAAAPLVDEQDTVPDHPSSFNGMYFDELYHARTAYEHFKGLEPYENTHPPLGKVFIMLGIAIFGMNPFGWRIIGALFGAGMVPIFYLFGRRLFKNAEYALLGAALFAFDFMHFTQTRIATIDVYAVFFILLMYYYMYQYYCMSFYTDGLKATYKPLGLAGVFFALGAASKWICIYAGGGLAVLLVLSFIKRYREYREATASGDAALMEKTKGYWKNVVNTLLFCCVFFIAIPVAVYVLSYLPYMLSVGEHTLEDVWGYQKYMWNYHSGLEATHPYQSAWWQWPFTLVPMWYYQDTGLPEGQFATLTASGNPAVWWVCTIATVVLIISRMMRRTKGDPGLTTLFVGAAANFLPWVLVTRCTFIYHFFATVPFIVFCGVFLLQSWERKNPSVKWVKWAWMAAAVMLFLLLYPGLSGYEIPIGYAKFLKLLPGGNLMYGA